MKPKKIWANFGVKEVSRTRQFYSALGFTSNEGNHKNNALASFLIGTDDFVVHFFEQEKFESAIKSNMADLKQGNEIIFTLWADSVA